MHCPKLAWNRSTAKESNINRSRTGMSNLISSLSDSYEKWGCSKWTPGRPWTRHTYSGRERAIEGSGPKEHLHKNSSRELKCTVCFCLSKHDSLSCFCYSEIKNIWLVCQAAKAADTPGHQHPSGHAREDNQNSSDFRKSLLGSVLNTKLMYHQYTWRLTGILSKLKKKKQQQQPHRNQKWLL